MELHVGHLGGIHVGREAGIVSSCWTLGREAGIVDLHVLHVGD